MHLFRVFQLAKYMSPSIPSYWRVTYLRHSSKCQNIIAAGFLAHFSASADGILHSLGLRMASRRCTLKIEVIGVSAQPKRSGGIAVLLNDIFNERHRSFDRSADCSDKSYDELRAHARPMIWVCRHKASRLLVWYSIDGG